MHLFYKPFGKTLELDEEESRHCTKVLRLVSGDIIFVTDGEGQRQRCSIAIDGKRVYYKILDSQTVLPRPFSVTVAVAPTRKAERNEWMVEKMTEIGVDIINFIVTENTNRETISRVVNLARLEKISVAAMKQSQQFYKPKISLTNKFEKFIKEAEADVKLIAYVPDNELSPHVFQRVRPNMSTILLIGPEGDFSPSEVDLAMVNGYETVSLGSNRLRTETAAVAGCQTINLAQLMKEIN